MENSRQPSLAAMMKPKSKTHIPITMSELWGPVTCEICLRENAWTIWVTPEQKDFPFEKIFRDCGLVICDVCGVPSPEESSDDK